MTKSNNTKNMGAPKPGSYAPPPAQQAQHTTHAWPSSSSPGPKGHTTQVTSRQPATKFPSEATTTDNTYAKDLLKGNHKR
jgi:hypothetical protein